MPGDVHTKHSVKKQDTVMLLGLQQATSPWVHKVVTQAGPKKTWWDPNKIHFWLTEVSNMFDLYSYNKG